MVLLAPLVGAAVFLSGFAAALPTNYGSSSSGYDSSSDDSYGSSSDDSYGSSSDSYGSSSDSYGSSDSSSSYDSSGYDSNYGGDYNSGDSYSTETIDSTSTYTAYSSEQTYGSGSSYWGGSGYADCVNQCIAQYGYGMGGEYQATQTAGVGGYSGGSDSESGVTHTIIVSPSQGVKRMIPFYTNASVGDVIEFHWGSNNHTVTKSSALTPCNKSSEAPVYASGEQNEGFMFRQVVNNTDPDFFYCGTPGHCEAGMFGVINPGMALPGAPTSLGVMMSSMAANDSDLSTYAAYTSNITGNNDAAAGYGDNLDLSAFPEWAMRYVAENVMYSRNVLALNPSMEGNLTLPMDTSDLNAASSGPAAAASVSAAPGPVGAAAADATSAAPASSGSAAAPTSSSSPNTSGASSVASPRFLVAAAVVVATVFAL